MGIRFRLGCCLGEDIQAEDLEKEYDNVFYATGAWKRPVLGFDGEEFTEFGLQFLMEVNQWMNKKDRRHVLVVGGGNVAMDVAITARRLAQRASPWPAWSPSGDAGQQGRDCKGQGGGH